MSDAMGRFEHGGDIYAHKGAIDFSANINPLGMPGAVIEAIRQNASNYDVYPDHECRELRQAIAHAEGTRPEYVICTAGASDLIQRVCLAFRPRAALVTAPCFSGYEEALEQAGTTIVRHVLREEDEFNVTDAILGFTRIGAVTGRGQEAPGSDEGVSESSGEASGSGGRASGLADAPRPQCPVDLVFLCSPNNPTGLTISRELLEQIIAEAHGAGVPVVLDECFLDFTQEQSAVDLCERFPNLIVMRAFTKLYAMAGLRLGYGICADADLLGRLKAMGQLWAVSTPAQVAGIAALGVPQWAEETRAYVDEQRARLAEGLEACGMRVIPGEANYLMFRSPQILYDELLARGFLIRRCENYVGLDSSWYRVAVRTEEENAAFLAALKEVCS